MKVKAWKRNGSIEHGSRRPCSLSRSSNYSSNRSKANFDENKYKIPSSYKAQGLYQKKTGRRMDKQFTRTHSETAEVYFASTTKLAFTMILLFSPIVQAPPVPSKGPELFGKGQQLDKLILKNQIGYHFKKVVKEVSQELFLS